MKDTSINSKKLSPKVRGNLRNIKKARFEKYSSNNNSNNRFSYNELVNLKKLTLVRKGEDRERDEYGYDDIEYYLEPIDRPTFYNMQWKNAGDRRWWRHTRNDDRGFSLELADKSSIKEINKKLYDEGFKIKEIVKD